MTAGVPQGTRLGPLLFLVLIDDATRESPIHRWKYVDDMSLAAAGDRGDGQPSVQIALRDLEEWCEGNRVRLNPTKCSIMHVAFCKTPPPLLDFTLCNDILKEVSTMKLLGVTIQSDLKWNNQVSSMISRAGSRLYMLRRLKQFRLPAADLVTVYTGFVRPLLEYACPVWHSSLTTAESNMIEQIQKRALRMIFPGRSYTEALLNADIVDLASRREELSLTFARNVAKSGVIDDWFTENNPVRTLRNTKKYKEPRCRTNRYKNSPVPYMTRLLNSH